MTLIGRAWFAATMILAIGISESHLPDWKISIAGVLVGVSTWAFKDR